MMDLLKIPSLRPGKNGSNPQAPNYANYDEAQANPYPKLPDPLVMKNGKKVTSAAMWWSQRRPEIVEDFDREVYGRVPKKTPKVAWRVISLARDTNGGVPVVTKQILGHVDNSSFPSINVDIQVSLTVPANAKGPVPVIMQFGFAPGFGRGGFGPMGAGRGPAPGRGALPGAAGRGAPGAGAGGFGGRGPTGPTWQQQVLAKGWGYAAITPGSIQADNGAGLRQGIIGLCNKGEPRKADDWGALCAWAWGASRALDFFETLKEVDAKHVALEGHSRYGKATMVTMVYEPRISNGFVSSSGEGGAKLWRHLVGQQVESLGNAGEYYWMAGNFIRYSGPLTVDDLPIDQHQFIALVAPRPIFISGGEYIEGNGVPGTNSRYSLENWQDTPGTFMATAGASPVWKLLGKKPLSNKALGLSFDVVPDPVAVKAKMPPPLTPLIDGDIAFRQHDQGHVDAPNWPTFIEFAGHYFKSPGFKN